MPLDDLSDVNAALRKMQKDIQRTPVTAPGGDSGHVGAGFESIQLGVSGTAAGQWAVSMGKQADAHTTASVAIGYQSDASGLTGTAVGYNSDAIGASSVAVGESADASGLASVAVGLSAYAAQTRAVALGDHTYANHARSTALGYNATTTAADQLMLGTSGQTVVVPGTFSNPSARRLKQNIIPAPTLTDAFPELVEYEYITAEGQRRIGYIADDLVGTDAERFVTFDDEGRPSGIDYLGMLVVQNAQLHARLVALENLMGD